MPTSTMRAASALEWVAQAKQLYSLPAVALRVLELTSSPDADATALKSCLEQDPALSARLLRVVNSSVFGFPGQIADIGRAIGVLGVRPLRMLVLGFSLPRRLLEEIDTRGLARYWRRALIRAVAAREICRERNIEGGDEAFVAGLFHDIGELVFWKECGPAYARLVARVDEQGEPRAKFERALLGCAASELSARLLVHWKLPSALSAAIGATGRECVDEPLPVWTTALRMADQLAWLIDNESPAAWRPCEGWGAWSEEALSDWVGMVERQVEQLAKGMQVSLPPGRDYRDVLAAAQARLAELHEEDLLAGPPERAESPRADVEPCAAPDSATAVAEAPPVPSVQQAEPSGQTSTIASAIAMSLAHCRAAREPLSLTMLRIRPKADLAVVLGREKAESYHAFVAANLHGLENAETHVLKLDVQHYALLLRGQDRTAACATGRELLQALAAWPYGFETADGRPASLVLGAGIATLDPPPPHFPPNQLFAAAERCLFAASRGGGGIKSIEL